PNRLTRPSTLMTASGMESAIRPIWGMAAGRATAAAPPAKEFAMTGNEAVAGRAPAVETPGRVRLRTLVYIRWIAVLGQLLTLLVVHYGLGFDLPFATCIAVIAISAALNIAITVRRSLSDHLTDRVAAQYLAYDILQLSVLLFLTGGLQNPFSVLIL